LGLHGNETLGVEAQIPIVILGIDIAEGRGEGDALAFEIGERVG
jgi:hypothetical protein